MYGNIICNVCTNVLLDKFINFYFLLFKEYLR